MHAACIATSLTMNNTGGGRSRCCGARDDLQQQPDRQQSARHSDSPRKITERLTLAPGASTVKPGYPGILWALIG